ncbi:MAG: [FeFe] hydrogenase H-cluster maturation GTPase HydF [Verrucomicrobiota bacterium]|jgi:[FeFe] hydrogenase H-cluster maturation GTPase HydF|nr:[FeFe] hydrogenase H-cluster maturation GTPase HydF [Verrucomicrobiota bacterium]
MKTTPNGERIHLTLFGRRNVGKSSLINALTGQEVALVSPVKGTTTDPVWKAMELLPLGPVVVTDTPGLDDIGALGAERVRRTLETVRKTDVALLVTDAAGGVGPLEKEWLARLADRRIPVVLVFNKSDEAMPSSAQMDGAARWTGDGVHIVSAATGAGVEELKTALAHRLPPSASDRKLVGDLVAPGDVVLLVTPIDSAAPKGRLILPQQQVLRDLLDASVLAVVVKETELAAALKALKAPPRLVVTDSQAFAYVAALLPVETPLTSFSILFARFKGDVQALVDGARHVAALKDGDRILVAEGCTHHRQQEDIGTVKIPRWLSESTGKSLQFVHTAGGTYPADLGEYALVVHCGGCMLNRREMQARIQQARNAGVPIVNYGVLIACLEDILPRALQPLGLTF